MERFPEQLLNAQKAAGMTQEQLADAVHVARNTISSWEHGRTQPDLETLRLLGHLQAYADYRGLRHTGTFWHKALPLPVNQEEGVL